MVPDGGNSVEEAASESVKTGKPETVIEPAKVLTNRTTGSPVAAKNGAGERSATEKKTADVKTPVVSKTKTHHLTHKKMKEICVNIPELEADQTIEVEIRVKGKNQELLYRVEAFDLSKADAPDASRVDQLRILIQSYDPAWELVQIGIPDAQVIPVMFRQRGRQLKS